MKTLKLLTLLGFCLLSINLVAQNYYTYVSDAANFTSGPYQIVQFDTNGENPVVYIDDQLAWPQDILFIETQDVVLVSNLNSGRITKYDSTTGVYIEDFAQVAGGPTRMKVGDDGLLYVIQWSNSNNKVLRFQLDGTFVDEYTDMGVVQSIGVDWDDSGNLYVSSFAGGTVTKFDPNGDFDSVHVNTNLSGPTNVEIEGGVMYVLDWNAGKCVRFNANDGSYIDDFITTLTNPEGLAFLPNGDLLIGDNGTNSVRRFDSAGTDLGDYTTGGGLLTPNAVVLRDEIFLSVNDNLPPGAFISPTVGDRFQFDLSYLGQLEEIRVYSVTGTLITTVQFEDQSSWNAQYLAEGIYIMVASSTSGQKSTQKIIIDHD